MFEATLKARIEADIQKAIASRAEYKKKYLDEIQTNGDLSKEGKDKRNLQLVETYNTRLRAFAGSAVTDVESEIKAIGKNREEALRLRNQQAYNVQMQNALHTLELAGGQFSKQEVIDIITPFATDTIAMTTLRAAAIRGGMDRDRAIDWIAYQDDPSIAPLESLKRLLLKLKASSVDAVASEETFSLDYALITMMAKFTDNLRVRSDA